MSEYVSHLKQFSSEISPGRVLVHSDMFRVRSAVRHCSSIEHMLSTHIDLLTHLVTEDRLVFPTFNYDYLRRGVYDIGQDCSQIGPLSEYARTSWSDWRSMIPVFNFCGKGSCKNESFHNCIVDPFGDESFFSDLYNEAGSLLFYGSTMASATAVHYIERKSGGPVYRYDKWFSGLIVNNDSSQHATLKYHCRPQGCSLEYDFQKIELHLTLEGLIKAIELPGFTVKLVNYKAMVDFLVDKMNEDALFLLDKNSYQWVSEKLSLLGRRFEVNDFETGIA